MMTDEPEGTTMMTFTRILCPIDFSEPSEHALAHAVAFARWYEADLTVMHVVPTFEPSMTVPTSLDAPSQVIYPVSREEVLEALHRAAKAAGAPPSRISAVAEAGAVVKTIVDRAISDRMDLLVLGTHGRSGFDRALLGSVTERVIRTSPCPVLTVPPKAAASTGPLVMKQILCPVDFSPSSLVGVGVALDLARQTEGSVTLLHAVEWPSDGEPRTHAHFAVPEYRQALVDDAKARLHAVVADESRTWCDIQERVVAGRAKNEIVTAATQMGAHLIVMGAQGRDGIGLRLFGSTTERVVREAHCPVLSVRGTVALPS
jgi:nucleotide-binding universal stress UspA family protein